MEFRGRSLGNFRGFSMVVSWYLWKVELARL